MIEVGSVLAKDDLSEVGIRLARCVESVGDDSVVFLIRRDHLFVGVPGPRSDDYVLVASAPADVHDVEA